jgi:hypothetical protein
LQRMLERFLLDHDVVAGMTAATVITAENFS